MGKALSQSDVTHETERWAAAKKKLAALEAKQTAEIEPFVTECERQVEEITARYSAPLEKLQKAVEEREAVITEWLDKRPKTTTIDTKHAVAEVVHGSKNGVRVPDIKKLIALCKKKSVDFYQFVTVLLGQLDKALGKAEVDAICTIPTVPTKIVTVKLKD